MQRPLLFFFLFVTLFISACGRKGGGSSDSAERIAPIRAPERYQGIVVIDAGHGGDDHGTHSVDTPKLHEKQLTLSTAKLVKAFLEQEGFQVVLTRQGDFFVPLKTRAQFANDIRAHFFVSIHYNSAPNRLAKGIEVYYFQSEENKKRSVASKLLAEDVLKELVRATRCENRGVRHGNFAVIRETKMPAILVEAGFMSNPEEMKSLRSPAYEQRIAQAIAHAVSRYAQECSRRDSNARPVA